MLQYPYMSTQPSKNVLVTGGAGYIGSACVAALLEVGHSVTVFHDLSTGQREKVPAAATLITGDITDAAALRAACGSAPFDAVIHFAAKKAVAESEANPSLYMQTNVVGSCNLLAAMSEFAIPQLIFSSSAAVYQPPAAGLVTERTPLEPVNVYVMTKKLVEDIIYQYFRTGQLKHYHCLRYFNVAGDAGLHYQEQNAQNVFPLIASAAKAKQPFYIFGSDYDTPDGTCVRDYIHLNDLVSAHLAAFNSQQDGIYNLGTSTGYSVRELAEAFNEALPEPLIVELAERRLGDPAALVADGSKAKQDLGWQPTKTLADMVESTLKVYMN